MAINRACLTLPATARKSLKPRTIFGTGGRPGPVTAGPATVWVATSSTSRGTKSKRNEQSYSMSARSYLDWNATAPMREEAKAAFTAAISLAGNPSSVHAEGRAVRALIEAAREEVATLVGTLPGNVVFTSSGTEANMLALTPAIETADEKRPRTRLFISAIEHVSVRGGGQFPRDVTQ